MPNDIRTIIWLEKSMSKPSFPIYSQESRGIFSYALYVISIISIAPFTICGLSLFGRIEGEQALPWFLVGLAMIGLPLVAQVKLGDEDLGGSTKLVPVPFQVQREIHSGHRDAVAEHYDFVYVCLLDTTPELSGQDDPDGDKDPQWYTHREVKEMHEKGEVFSDIYPTFTVILEALQEDKGAFLNAQDLELTSASFQEDRIT